MGSSKRRKGRAVLLSADAACLVAAPGGLSHRVDRNQWNEVPSPRSGHRLVLERIDRRQLARRQKDEGAHLVPSAKLATSPSSILEMRTPVAGSARASYAVPGVSGTARAARTGSAVRSWNGAALSLTNGSFDLIEPRQAEGKWPETKPHGRLRRRAISCVAPYSLSARNARGRDRKASRRRSASRPLANPQLAMRQLYRATRRIGPRTLCQIPRVVRRRISNFQVGINVWILVGVPSRLRRKPTLYHRIDPARDHERSGGSRSIARVLY